MELSSIHHIEPGNLADFAPDLFVASLSHDARCLVISNYMDSLNCRKVVLYRPPVRRHQEFEENKRFFEERGFEIIRVETKVPQIGSLLAGHGDRELKMVFDCTSMSMNWYYEFFRWFSENQDDFDKVKLRFAYSMAGYVPDDSPRKVTGIKEFLVNDGRRLKPKKALILGLGHEANVSESIVKMEKPDLLYLFYADPPVDKRFVEQVFVNNHSVIQGISMRNMVAYPIHNGQEIYQHLIEIILPIRNEYSITLIPQGPRIFSVAAMLVHLSYPDTLISYPEFRKALNIDRIPCGEPVVLDVCFEGDE